MNATHDYTAIRRTIDPRDGALRVTVRPLNCSHDEHTVTVYREYAVEYPGGEPEWVEYNWSDQESEPAPTPGIRPTWRYRAAIEDDIIDADFRGPEDSIEDAIDRALSVTCEDDELPAADRNLAGPDYE
jgi:hypothetical protein